MKKFNIIMCILLLFCACALVIVIVVNQNVTFELKGNEEITIDFGDENKYLDEGYIAKVFNTDLSDNIIVKSSVNYDKIGSYNINYYLTYAGKIYMLTRDVTIVDRINPEINLVGDKWTILSVGDKYEELGAIAIDNYDGDITSDIIINGNVNTSEEGNYTVVYTIKDYSGNENSIERHVIVKK